MFIYYYYNYHSYSYYNYNYNYYMDREGLGRPGRVYSAQELLGEVCLTAPFAEPLRP